MVPLLVVGLLQQGADAFLQGAARAVHLPPGWERGNRYYDQAFTIVNAAIAQDQVTNGPWLKVTATDYLELTFRRGSSQEQDYFRTFFGSKAGEVYWDYIVDSATCSGLLKRVSQDGTVLTDAQQKTIAHWQEALPRKQREADLAFEQLTKAQQGELGNAHKSFARLARSEAPDEREFQQQLLPGGQFPDVAARRALAPTMTAITPLMQEFAASRR